MADARVSWTTGGDVIVGQQYGKAVTPYSWEAMLEIVSVTATGDGDKRKIIGYTPIESEHYGAYDGGAAVLYTDPADGNKTFSAIPAQLAISGYVKDLGAEGIEYVVVSDGTDSDETSSSGYWFFASASIPYSETLTPVFAGYVFEPETLTLTDRYWNVANNDFVGSADVPEKPTNPSPSDGATSIKLSQALLNWSGG